MNPNEAEKNKIKSHLVFPSKVPQRCEHGKRNNKKKSELLLLEQQLLSASKKFQADSS